MNDRSKLFVPAFSFVVVISVASAQGPGSGGAGGLSSPRSGLGIRSNPIVNPAPSLTPSQVLNPRGSLSAGQVLNPAPSLRRPRSGGPTIGTQQPEPSARQAGPSASQTVEAGNATYRTRRPATGYSTASHFEELSTQLLRFKNGQSWAKYLVPPKELLSDETTEGVSDELRKRLKRFEKLSNDPTYAKLTALPAFWLAHESLKLKVGQTTDRSPSLTVGDRILQGVTALDARIANVAPGSDWPKRLSLDELRAAISTTSEQPATDDERESAKKIVAAFQAVAKSEADAVVNELPEFKETLEALQEYLKPLDDRAGQGVSSYFDQLDGQLLQYTNGESWAKYLALPKELLDGGPTAVAGEPTQKLLKRFERLSADSTYSEVTALTAFRPAYEALKQSADQTDTSPSTSAVASASANQPSAVSADQQAVAANPVATADPQTVAPADKTPNAAADKDKKSGVAAEAGPSVADRSEPPTADPVTEKSTVGERLLQSVMALDQRVAKVTPDKGWSKRLSIDQLEVTVSMTSDQPASDSDRESLEEILKSYQAIAKDKDDAVVNQLTEFKEALEALQQYLNPSDRQPPKE
jgi:hypothetical protein